MAKFYSVITSFYDNGKVSASLGEVIEADKIPESSSKYLRNRDVYVDWFVKRSDAVEFKKSALNA